MSISVMSSLTREAASLQASLLEEEKSTYWLGYRNGRNSF